MADLIVPKKETYVTKSEKLLLARYELNELSLKLIAIIYSNVKRGDDSMTDYEIRVSDIANIMGVKYAEIYNEIKQAVDELLNNPITIEQDNGNWVKFNWIADALYENGTIKFSLSKRLIPYILELQSRFLKYSLKNILPLKSKYSIRLYELLRNKFNEKTYKNNKKMIEYIEKVDNLKMYLSIPRSYNYGMFKQRIIIKSQEELKANTDIEFEFEELKTGRKVTHIKFKIIDKSKEEKDTKLTEVNYKIDTTNNLALWKKEILQNADNKIIALGDECYLIKDGLLHDLNDKIITKEEAWEVWNRFFKNKNEVKILEKDKLGEILEKRKEKIKQFKLEELKEQWLGVLLEDIFVNGDYYKGQIVDIQDYENYDNFSVIVKIGEKYYKVSNINLSWLKKHQIIK